MFCCEQTRSYGSTHACHNGVFSFTNGHQCIVSASPSTPTTTMTTIISVPTTAPMPMPLPLPTTTSSSREQSTTTTTTTITSVTSATQKPTPSPTSTATAQVTSSTETRTLTVATTATLMSTSTLLSATTTTLQDEMKFGRWYVDLRADAAIGGAVQGCALILWVSARRTQRNLVICFLRTTHATGNVLAATAAFTTR